MATNGQTVEEAIETLQTIAGHGIVFTTYEMKGVTPDGSTLEVTYDVKDDKRFQ